MDSYTGQDRYTHWPFYWEMYELHDNPLGAERRFCTRLDRIRHTSVKIAARSISRERSPDWESSCAMLSLSKQVISWQDSKCEASSGP